MVIRCWDCMSVIAQPDILGGKPGVAGGIRANHYPSNAFANAANGPTDTSVAYSLELTCGKCGTRYLVSMTQLPARAAAPVDERTDEQKEKDKLWKSHD